MEVRFTGSAWHFINDNGGAIQITAAEAKASCCGSILIPYVALGEAGGEEFQRHVCNGITVYIHKGIKAKAKQNLRVRLDVVWKRPRLVAEWT